MTSVPAACWTMTLFSDHFTASPNNKAHKAPHQFPFTRPPWRYMLAPRVTGARLATFVKCIGNLKNNPRQQIKKKSKVFSGSNVKGGIGSFCNHPVGSIYRLYTRYSPCLLRDYKIPTTLYVGTWKINSKGPTPSNATQKKNRIQRFIKHHNPL